MTAVVSESATGTMRYGILLAAGANQLDDLRVATRLMEDCAARSATWLRAHARDTAPAELVTRYQDWTRRVANGEPEAYVTGVAHFWSLRLKVTRDVLIPRPDTETLVRIALDMGADGIQRVADLGTGSGAVALSLAVERPNWRITGTDISEAALDVARANALDCALSGVRWQSGDWFDALDDSLLDGIVANPPYVADDDPALAASVRMHEPRQAVIADDQGLADLRRIIAGAPQRLVADGWLAVEHGYKQGEAVRALFDQAGFGDVRTHHDLAGQPRVTAGRLT